jgi:DNA-binding response OmpR family regulator
MPLKIYYLDDELELLEIFSDLFSSDDVVVTTFSDPKTAIEAIKASPPDLLFLDYRLPNTTGDQVALQIDPKIPKAIVTGDLSVTLEAKFDAKYAKPFSIKEVKAFINLYVDRRKTS